MSAQEQVLERGPTLRPTEYQYLANAADLVARLGARAAVLEETQHGIELFAWTLTQPRWRFHTVIGWPRPTPGRALAAHPWKIAGALHVIGSPSSRHFSSVRIEYGGGIARFVGPDGTVEVSGRVTTARDGRSAVPEGAAPLAEVVAYRGYIIDGVLLALARGIHAEMKVSPAEGDRWKIHVTSEANDDYDFFAAKVLKAPEAPFRGLYKAWILSELLLPLGDYIELGFLGSAKHPALHASWDGTLRDYGFVPVATEFYLEE